MKCVKIYLNTTQKQFLKCIIFMWVFIILNIKKIESKRKQRRTQRILIHYWLHVVVRKHLRFLVHTIAVWVLLSSWHGFYFGVALHACEIEILLVYLEYYYHNTHSFKIVFITYLGQWSFFYFFSSSFHCRKIRRL